MSKTVKFNVGMTCSGCSNAVKKVLTKIDGVEEVDTNLEAKVVLVTCNDNTDSEALLNALLKWSAASGKAVSLAA